MNRNYFLPIVLSALFCLILIFASLWREIESPIAKEPVIPPPTAPFKSYISGPGVIEASSNNISIGSPVNRIVKQVLVSVDQKVKKGDLLFRLDDRDLQANLKVQKAAYESALARFKKMEAYPRPEDLSTAIAAANAAKGELDLAKANYEMVLGLPDPRAISQEEKNRRLANYQQAMAKWEQAQAELEKMKAGTWKPDLEIARSEVKQAEANVHLGETEIRQTLIQSPIDGTVLQLKIREGEATLPDTFRTPMMIIGNTDDLYLRVSINQLDIPFFHSTAPAVAFLQGDTHQKFPLEFVRVEPFLVNKQTFTNEITETVDTRVLQIIYRIKGDDFPLYVGQQMDAFIETQSKDNSASL